ncbi:MAG: hypothetical protein PHR00_04755 [Patescibacteria group bacterium]|nr:hypothetical protein [Patescibacteria group bacterium]
MKKIIKFIVLPMMFLMFLTPVAYGVSFDKDMPGWEDEQQTQTDNNQQTSEGISVKASDVPNIIKKITKYFYNVFLIVSVGFILLSAFYFLKGGDNPADIKKAKSQLIYAVIGITIAILSFGIDKLIESIIKAGSH